MIYSIGFDDNQKTISLGDKQLIINCSENNIDEKLLKTINNELNKFNNNGNNNYSWELARKFCIDNDPNCKIWKERGSSIFYDL